MAKRTSWREALLVLISMGALVSCSPTPPTEPVAAPTLTAAGASPSATPTSAPTTTGAAGPSVSTQAGPSSTRRVVITLAADGSVTPNGERIDLAVGEPLALEVRGQRDDELHVHGIDQGIPVAAGDTVTETIIFDTPGSYEVESHDPARVVIIIRVR